MYTGQDVVRERVRIRRKAKNSTVRTIPERGSSCEPDPVGTHDGHGDRTEDRNAAEMKINPVKGGGVDGGVGLTSNQKDF